MVHLDLRPRSPSGVMLPSIDSPQGDQVERIAPTTARPSPTPRTAASAPPIGSVRQPSFSARVAMPEAGVSRYDARSCQLLIGSTDPLCGAIGCSARTLSL